MRYLVLQPFKTPIRRFHAGMEVDDTEIDGPLLAAEWAERGFLGMPEPAEEDLDALRLEASSLGLSPDLRWGAKRLRGGIEAAKAAKVAQADAAAAEIARMAEEDAAGAIAVEVPVPDKS